MSHDAVRARVATKDGTPVAGVLVEVVDNTGRVITDALTNAIGNVSLRLPAPPVYTLRCTDTDGTVRETPVSSRSGAHTEFIITPRTRTINYRPKDSA